MKRIRLWVAGLSIWLIFFFNVERILLATKVNLIQSSTYIFVALVVIVSLLFPKLRGRWFVLLMTFAVTCFLILWYNQPLLRRIPALAINDAFIITLLTIIQVSAIVLSGLLARQISQAFTEFAEIITDITFNHIGTRPKPFLETQGEMYRELKRARYYQRPLSVITFQFDEAAINTKLPDMITEVQQGMMKEFTLAKMSRVLDAHLRDFNSIALRDNSFIVMLPETDKKVGVEMAQQLGKALQEQMMISTRIGLASFPEDAVTFQLLIEEAMVQNQPITVPLEMVPSKPNLPQTEHQVIS